MTPNLAFQRLNMLGEWETIPATIRPSTWMGQQRYVVNYRISRVPCEAWIYGNEPTMRVVET